MSFIFTFTSFFFSCQSSEEEKNIGTQLEFVDPTLTGPHQIATRDEDMINRHGQELTLQVWYPSSEPDEDIHLYGDFFESGIADGGDVDCSVMYPVVLFVMGMVAFVINLFLMNILPLIFYCWLSRSCRKYIDGQR